MIGGEGSPVSGGAPKPCAPGHLQTGRAGDRFMSSFQPLVLTAGDTRMTPARAIDRGSPEIPTKTRERLLDAAERLFAERGFRAVSVRVITSHAGCNVAAVNYYFGGKENLYREMFRRRLGALREQRISSIRRAMTEAGSGATPGPPPRALTTAVPAPPPHPSGGPPPVRLFFRALPGPRL